MLTEAEVVSLKALIAGQREPQPGIERHFVMVMQGTASPCSPKEREWFEFWKKGSGIPSDSESYKWKYQEALSTIKQREEQIHILEDHVSNLKREAERLSELSLSKDQTNEQLRGEISRLQGWLKSAHAALEKYEPIGKPLGQPTRETENSMLYECQACGRPIEYCRCSG